MSEAGYSPVNGETKIGQPLWLLAELTYACPLQCPYCSNPVDFSSAGKELSTEEWLSVFRQARKMGATQLGLSGGEPLVRNDLEILVREARQMGFYTNLITSGVGMDAARVAGLKEAGLDHIQVSFQASRQDLNDLIAGTKAFEHKMEMAREVKANGFPMVLCFVLHRDNIDYMEETLDLAVRLNADYVELATTQYYGWAWVNRDRLLPERAQLETAEARVNKFRETAPEGMKIYYIVPDYYETRPKPCMNGWGKVFLTITPDGTALPCHAARQLPGLTFPNAREHEIEWIWKESPAFNKFRGYGWMKEPCRSCDEKEKDFGGCRCQAFMLTGDAANADPVCDKSPHHGVIQKAVDEAEHLAASTIERPMVFRNPRNSKKLTSVE